MADSTYRYLIGMESAEIGVQDGGLVFTTGAQKRVFLNSDGSSTGLSESVLGWFNVKDYGAKGNNATDDTTAIQAAINACAVVGGIVYFPAGTYKISATLTLPNRVSLVGAGCGANLDNPGVLLVWNPVSQLKWSASATGDKMILVSGPACVGIRDLGLDGNNTATYGLWLDQLQASTIENVGIQNCLTDLIYMGTTSNSANANSQHNRFDSIFLFTGTSNTGAALRLAGNAGKTADCCHNTFNRLIVDFAQDGLVLDLADNNTFSGVMCFRKTGTGYGVKFNADAWSNTFFHLQPSVGGVYVATPTSSHYQNAIYHYAKDNTEAEPTFQSSAAASALVWLEDTGYGSGWHVQKINTRDLIALSAEGLKGQNYPRDVGASGSAAAGGILYMMRVGLKAGDTITNVVTQITGAGSGLTLAKVAVYSKAGSLLASSADVHTAWQATGAIQNALSSPYVATSDDAYYLGFLVTGTTPPSMWRTNTAGTVAALSGQVDPWATGGSGLSDLPSSAVLSTTSATAWWIGWN